MSIKCACADSSERVNAERLIRRVDEIIEKIMASPLRFSERKATQAAVESWNSAKEMLKTIRQLPDCKE